MALLNRARMTVSGAPGTGTVTLNAAMSGFASFAEAGAQDATQYTYVIEDGNDFEIGRGTYTASGTTFSRDTVLLSKIGGTAGTTKLTASADATIAITIAKEDILLTSKNLSDVTTPATALDNIGGTPLAGNKNLTGGFTTDEYDNGTKSSGTFTPSPLNGAIQKCVNGGAFALAPYTTKACSFILNITNNGSAGAITTSGFDVVDGDNFDTTNGHIFRCNIDYSTGGSRLTVRRMA